MTPRDDQTQLDYLLHAMEAAAAHTNPAEHGYEQKRQALFAYVRGIEHRAATETAQREAAERALARWVGSGGLVETVRSVAEFPPTWPAHGNAPLAIAASYQLLYGAKLALLAERDRLTAALAEMTDAWKVEAQQKLDLITERDKLAWALTEAKRERDEAIAHDRQSYPTAWAYEQACKALQGHKDRADAAEAQATAARESGPV